MYPRLFHLHYLNTFGLCISIGLVLCFVVLKRYAKVKNMYPLFADFIVANAYVAILAGVLVSFLGQALFIYLKDPSHGFHLSTSSTFVSGLIGGISSFVIGYLAIGRRKYGPRLIEVGPIAPVCITIAHAFGRLGCFFSGCCYGIATDSCLGVQFPNLQHPVYPTQLFESAFLFCLFALLYYLTFKRNYKQSFALYLLAYGVFRFGIEFIRGDERGALIGSLSPSQTLSLVMIASSVGIYFLTIHLLRNYHDNPSLKHKI